MFVSEEEVREIKENRFGLDGMNIILTRRGDPSDIYQGSGFLRQTPDGKIEYTVYDRERESDLPEFLSLPLGTLIPDGQFYDLKLEDMKGRAWQGFRTLVNKSGAFGVKGTVCRGELFEAFCTGDTIEPDGLRLFLPGDFKIPTNAGTRFVEKTLQSESHRFDLNIWKIEDEEYDIIITKGLHGIEVDVTPLRHPLPDWFSTRLEEALWFSLALPAQWKFLEERNSGGHRFVIRAPRIHPTLPRVWPPLKAEHGKNAEHLGDLLIRYLKYVLPYSKPRYHPISATILRNLSASAVSLGSEALALSVAVESLVGREFRSLGSPPKSFLDDLSLLINHVSSWTGSDSLKRRAVRAISNWKGTNVREALKELVRKGVITEQQHMAWNALRHPMVHGSEINRPPDELILLRDLTYLCWLRIMFEVLGYVGPYTDRSSRGWSTSHFPSED